MKSLCIILISFFAFASVYYFTGKKEKEIITNIKYDSTYVINNRLLKNTLLTERRNNEKRKKEYEQKLKKLISEIKKLRNKSPEVKELVRKDTIIIYDTTKIVVFSSPFRIGTDTLNASGLVAFDKTQFYFNNVRFHYPIHYKYKYRLDWKLSSIFILIGTIIGVIIK